MEMCSNVNPEREDLDGVAREVARCAAMIRDRIATAGVDGELVDLVVQGIIQCFFDAMISGACQVEPAELIRGMLSGMTSSGSMNLPKAVLAAIGPDLRALSGLVRSAPGSAALWASDERVSILYERFLQSYAPIERSTRGVYYTPEPLARFIVRLVDDLLVSKLGFEQGLADPARIGGRDAIQVLDPSTGTGTFLLPLIHLLKKRGCDHVPRLVGYDLMPVPLALARARCNKTAVISSRSTGAEGNPAFFVANVLDVDPISFDGISVVIGNPPYARASQNKGTRVDGLLSAYKVDVRGDRNIQALSDDYVKFIRLAQAIIERNSFGIVAFVVNHTFLRGPIFRGMRRSLVESFDELYVLDLHGNSNVQENVPPGLVDQNVFPIQQGTCVLAAVRAQKRSCGASVHYHELFGSRTAKLAWLSEHDLNSTPWISIARPNASIVAFTPAGVENSIITEYETFTSIGDIFGFNSVGGKPGDDELLVSFDRDGASRQVQEFLAANAAPSRMDVGRMTEARRKILRAQQSLRAGTCLSIPYNYRPFDTRFAYYHERAWTRPVSRARLQCQGGNLFLLTTKLVKDREFNHAFVARAFTDVIFLSNTSSTNCYMFPARLYSPDGKATWNVSPGYQSYSERMGFPLDEADLPGVLGYIYAILWSRAFKHRFWTCLKEGAPRIPLVEDKSIHGELRRLGKQLVLLHLLERQALENEARGDIVGPGPGTNLVERMTDGRLFEGRLFVNQQQFFFPVSERAYDFRVGKYPVLRKWLDARVGRCLDESDVCHVKTMVGVLDQSSEIVEKVDRIIGSRAIFGS